jgi:anion-transporting  ArsA/GET3 family ATPase
MPTHGSTTSPNPSTPRTIAGESLLESLLLTKHVVICVGAGGVGKTTTAAALGVAAAQRGKRVLCLTIDPARRLAQSLGLEGMTTEAKVVDAAPFAAAGGAFKGELTVMMLDTKTTFDELVMKHASSPEKAKRLLENKLYKYVSTQLAGTQEYMAMEKLVTVRADPRYDLVVLDTPPTANALDFLDAPKRMTDALDSATMRWFLEAFQSTGKLSLNLLARSAALVLKGIGRLVGGGFLEAMAELITSLDDLFGGFRKRAALLEAELRSPEVAFVLVTSPSPVSIKEVLYFDGRLAEANMPRGAFVVNRFHDAPPAAVGLDPSLVAAAIDAHGLSLDPDAPARIVRAYDDASKLAGMDAKYVGALVAQAGDVPILRVPELPTDVHDAKGLVRLARLLTAT